MKRPYEGKTTSPATALRREDRKPAKGELSDQQLDPVSGGISWAHDDESPKETITF